MSYTLNRTVAGQIQRDTFAPDPTRVFTSGWSTKTSPALSIFGTSSIAILAGTPGGLDAGGVRESTPRFENGVWHVVYGAGDGTSNPTGNWRPQLATSPDLVTWTKRGYVLPSSGLANGTGGTYPGRDMGWLERRNGTYYIYPVFGGGGLAAPNGNGYVLTGPYISDCWKSTSTSLLSAVQDQTWEYIGNVTPAGAAGTFNSSASYTACVIADHFGKLINFYGTAKDNDLTTLNFAIASGSESNPGVFSPAYGPIFAQTDRVPENLDVFWHPTLKCFVGLNNEGSAAAVQTGCADLNAARFSTSLIDWKTNVTGPRWIQHGSSIDSSDHGIGAGLCALGYLRPVRINDDDILVDEQGYVAVCYDGDPDSSGFPATPNNHVGRRIKFSNLEPSSHALAYTPGGSSTPGTTRINDTWDAPDGTSIASYGHGWVVQSEAGGPAVVVSTGTARIGDVAGPTLIFNNSYSAADAVVDCAITTFNKCSLGILFRYQDVNNHLNLDVGFGMDGQPLRLTLYNASTTQVGSVIVLPSITAPATAYVTLKISGTDLFVTVNGNFVGSFANLPVTAAGYFGLRNGNGGDGARYASTFTVKDLPTETADPGHTQALAPASHTSFFADFIGSYTGTVASGAGLGFDYLTQSNGDSYRCLLTPGAGLSLVKVVGGVPSVIGSATGVQVSTPGYDHRIRVETTVSGSSVAHKLTLDGETQVTFTDTGSSLLTGTGFRFYSKGVASEIRLFTASKPGGIQIQGLTAGQVVTFNGPNRIPMERATATGTSLTSATLKHYPLDSIQITGGSLSDPLLLPIPGMGYGGDVLAIVADTVPVDPGTPGATTDEIESIVNAALDAKLPAAFAAAFPTDRINAIDKLKAATLDVNVTKVGGSAPAAAELLEICTTDPTTAIQSVVTTTITTTAISPENLTAIAAKVIATPTTGAATGTLGAQANLAATGSGGGGTIDPAIGTAITAIKAKTDKILVDPANGGVVLAPAGLELVQVESGVNARQALGPILAASAGVIAGSGATSGQGSVQVSSPVVGSSPGVNRINATLANGTRTATTVTFSAPIALPDQTEAT